MRRGRKKSPRDLVSRISGKFEDGDGKVHQLENAIVLDLTGGVELKDLLERAFEMEEEENLKKKEETMSTTAEKAEKETVEKAKEKAKAEIKDGEAIYWKELGDRPDFYRVGVAEATSCERCGEICQINGFWVDRAGSLQGALEAAEKKFGAKRIDYKPQETGWNERLGIGVCQSCTDEIFEQEAALDKATEYAHEAWKVLGKIRGTDGEVVESAKKLQVKLHDLSNEIGGVEIE